MRMVGLGKLNKSPSRAFTFGFDPAVRGSCAIHRATPLLDRITTSCLNVAKATT